MARQGYRRRRREASRVFAQVFDLKGGTALGGLNELGRFVRKLGIERKLGERFGRVKARWSEWGLDRVLRILLDASFAGMERLYHFEDLETEPLLCARHGVKQLPDVKTLYRDLRRFEDAALLRELHEVQREVVVEGLRGEKRLVLEFDSTVETLYGRQEGARVGPNPHKPGRPSYHPLLARERITDLIVHHVLRPGDTGTATGITSFLHQTLDISQEAGTASEILARLDSGFETDEVLRILERRGVGYVVKMRATPDLAHGALEIAARTWKDVEIEGDGQVQATWLFWRRSCWKYPRRVVAVRKRETESLQGHLFDEDGWSYSFYVTDRDWEPEDVARFYDKRADVERTICEAKNDLWIDHVPTASFGANAADLAIKVLSRNILVLYRDRSLRLKTRIRIMTLRRRFLWVAGRLVRRGGRFLLRLAQGSPLHSHLPPHALRC